MKTKKRIKEKLKFGEVGAAILITAAYFLILSIVTINYDSSKTFDLKWNIGLYSSSEFWENVIVEAHGLLLDLLVIGVVAFSINKIYEKKSSNRRYQEEINDFREWKTDESASRISSNVKKLVRNGIHKIDLSQCYLKKMDLRNLDLTESRLWGADLGETSLKGSKLNNVFAKGLYLGGSDCQGAEFNDAFLKIIRCKYAKFNGCTFTRSDLTGANFEMSIMKNVDFSQANLKRVRFCGADLGNANFTNAKNLTVDQLLEAGSIKGAHVDAELLSNIELRKPESVCVYQDDEGRIYKKLI